VLALSPVPEEAASARFRVYQYERALARDGIQLTVRPFATTELFRILYQPGRYLTKATLSLRQGLAFWRVFARRRDFDVFLVHREVLPVGPPVVERALARLPRRAVVYDFDDAIYLPNVSEANRIVGLLKWPSKVPVVIRLSHGVVAGNEYLARYARVFNPAVTVIPTCVDPAVFVPRDGGAADGRPVVGWIGSPTTRRYLLTLREVLAELARSHRFILRVAGAGRPIEIPGVHVEELPWSLDREVQLFNQCHVGLYPLPDDEWTRGKCGFKAIQFMACGVPVVASPVGVNRELIRDGENGFLADGPADWAARLEALFADAGLRDRLARAGRETVVKGYSVNAHAGTLARVLRLAHEAAAARRPG
jgi:glycosyltransferase involved in cell wall biosynthesis